jgi:hypothetical protein
VPRRDDWVLELPAGLFTNGWGHALEDTELAFLLTLAFMRAKYSGEEAYVAAGLRLLRVGLGRDAYHAHNLLERFGLVEVQVDSTRRTHGRVRDYAPGTPLISTGSSCWTTGSLGRPAKPSAVRSAAGWA